MDNINTEQSQKLDDWINEVSKQPAYPTDIERLYSVLAEEYKSSPNKQTEGDDDQDYKA